VINTDLFGPPSGTPFGDPIENEFPDGTILYAYDSEASRSNHYNIIDQTFIDYLNQMDPAYYNSISYSRAVQLNVVDKTSTNNYIKVTTKEQAMFFGTTSYFNELPDNQEFILSQYDILSGVYPQSLHDVVLIVDSQNRLNLKFLNALGISVNDTYTFNDFLNKTFKVVNNNDYYSYNGSAYVPSNDYESMYNSTNSITLNVVGIMRVKEEASSELLDYGIGYTTMLTDELLRVAKTSDIVIAQTASPTINVLTNQPFNPQITYQEVMRTIGGDDSPTGIQIYPKSFDDKELIKDYLDAYNVGKEKEDKILYTDLAEQISSTISQLINTITIILAAFAGISLVVSSVMIGIITYVSVVERTKEIGIMRSLGARKKDISRIFNAETLLIGLTSGVFGVVVAQILNFPINLIINNLIEVSNFSKLMFSHAILLVVLSTVLTLIAGLIPSGIAARKDPVIALRTE
jgi:putative ABC transport system permease protein